MATPVSIVIPAFNQLDYCRQCVASIRANTRHAHTLILVDNGSTDGVGAFFDSVPGALVVHTGENLGFAGGVNRGMERAEGHVLLLNSDTLVPPGWLTRLVEALERNGRVGAVGPYTNYASGAQMVPGLDFRTMEEIEGFSESLVRDGRGRLAVVDLLIGFCMLIREEAWRKVGLFDETFGIGNFEDNDYCCRLREAGYLLAIAEDCFVFHYGSRTFGGMGIIGENMSALMGENEEKFAAKWGSMQENRLEQRRASEDLNEHARAALDEKDTASAVRLLGEAIKADPLLPRNHNDLGAILWGLDRRNEAFTCFRRAVRLDPGYMEARANLMDAATALGREDEAAAMLEPGAG